jgi:hypothetical protein
MPTTHPVDFEEKVRLPKGGTNADYPYSLKAADLMKDFVYAALDADESLVETVSGEKGYQQRRLKIPALPGGDDPVQLTAEGGSLSWSAATSGIPTPPTSGTYVLGAVDGTMQWIETEACD